MQSRATFPHLTHKLSTKMGIVRNALRSLIDHELGVLGGQLDRLESAHADLAVQLDGSAKRFDLLQKRLSMRVSRAVRDEPQDPASEFQSLLRRQAPPPREEDNGMFTDFDAFRRR